MISIKVPLLDITSYNPDLSVKRDAPPKKLTPRPLRLGETNIMSKVTVYRFRKYDVSTAKFVPSKCFATLETIKAISGTEKLEPPIEIESFMLDDNGMYTPMQPA